MSKSVALISLDEFKVQFDEEFKKFLDIHIKKIQKTYKVAEINQLLEYIKTLSESGKRLRPYLVQSSYTHYGGKKDISPFLFGIELLHIFALVHDDIMDEAKMRHNKSTAHIEYQKYYQKNSIHTALSQAILIGDLIFSLAEECFFQENTLIGAKNVVAAQREYRTLVNEVIYGQMLDVGMAANLPVNQKKIYTKMALKSGNYSIMRPLLIGGKLAGGNSNNIAFLKEYGQNVGVAFQIQDDVLDCVGKSETFGKNILSDMQSAQQTYISYFMLNKVSATAREAFLPFFGRTKKYTEKESIYLSDLLKSSGAIAFANKETIKHFSLAEAAITKYNQKKPKIWTNILETLQARKK